MVWLPWQSGQTALPVRPGLLRRHPVDALLVGDHHLLVRQVVLLLDRLVLVAPQAGRHDVEAEGPRRGILRLADVVLPVAVVARRDVRDALRPHLPVGAHGVRFRGVAVAPAAVDLRELFVRRFRVGVTGDAGALPVDRGTVRLQVDVERQRLPVGQRLLDRLVPVAIHALAHARGGPGGKAGRQQRRGGEDRGKIVADHPLHSSSVAIRVTSGGGVSPRRSYASISSSSMACSCSMSCRESFPSIQVKDMGAKSGFRIT